jgi:hypothetical protein
MIKYKPINPKEKTFYIFEVNSKKFSVFDSQLDIPIYSGTWNMCEGIIRSIKKNMPSSSIYYYTVKKDNKLKLDIQWSHNM